MIIRTAGSQKEISDYGCSAEQAQSDSALQR